MAGVGGEGASMLRAVVVGEIVVGPRDVGIGVEGAGVVEVGDEGASVLRVIVVGDRVEGALGCRSRR